MSDGHVVVVGGGVAGLCCAYYLRRLQFDVTVVESNRIGSGASLGNGGWLCPAQAGPLPEPGLTLYGMRALFNRDSSLYFKRSELQRLAPWLLRFRTYCNPADHAAGTTAIAQLGYDVFDLIEEMRADGVEFELHKQGMVYAARSVADARNELQKLAPMRDYYDLPDDVITGTELHELEPALADEVDAGFLIKQHWHVRPDTLTKGLADALRRDGVEIQEGAEVFELVRQGRRITHVRTAAGDLAADTVVLAAGSWTTPLAHTIGISLPMEPGKGYSFTVEPSVLPQHAVLLVDIHVGCTPYAGRIRIGGTMEFSGINNRLDRRRIESILTGAQRSFQPFASPRDRERVGGDATDHRGRPAGARPRRPVRQHLPRHRLRHAGRDPGTLGGALARRDDRDRQAPAAARALPARSLRPDPAPPRRAQPHPRGRGRMSDAPPKRLRVAIIGSGNIGTDLMIKVERSPVLELVGVAGIDPESDGLRKAREHGHTATHDGLPGLLALVDDIDLAFDATSAGAHPEHARLLAERGIRSVDLTPAALGPAVVPPVNLSAHSEAPEVNLITCGAQATIPIVAAISSVADVGYAETVSTVSSRSAGPGTRQNIDEFTTSTARGLESIGGAREAKAIIILNPANPPIMMRNTIYAEVGDAGRRRDRRSGHRRRRAGRRSTSPDTG